MCPRLQEKVPYFQVSRGEYDEVMGTQRTETWSKCPVAIHEITRVTPGLGSCPGNIMIFKKRVAVEKEDEE